MTARFHDHRGESVAAFVKDRLKSLAVAVGKGEGGAAQFARDSHGRQTRQQVPAQGVVVAESDDTVVVEGNHYFPADSLRSELFSDTSHTSVCPWKGTASYKSITVDGETNENAAWFYPTPKDAAAEIKDRFAFWKGVKVE